MTAAASSKARDYLKRFIEINSTRGKEAAMADALEPILRQLGFTLEAYPKNSPRRNILASRGKEASLCVYGHMDTVPVYEGWKTDPFTLTLEGDRLYGRGTHDMKGGIAAFLAALELVPRDLPLKVLFCYDEEYDSEGAWQVVRERAGWFEGVTHMLSVETGTDVDIPEGQSTITLGRRGRARFQVEVHGYSAHGGTTERGISAISIASKLIPAIESAPMAAHPKLWTGSQFVINLESKTEAVSLPDRCYFEIDRHFVPPETVQSILKNYQGICDDVLASLTLTEEQRALVGVTVQPKPRTYPYMEPYVTSSEDSLVQTAVAVMARNLGKPAITYGRSVADENIFAKVLNLPTIVIGPIGGNDHSPNEWVSATALEKYCVFYKEFLLETTR